MADTQELIETLRRNTKAQQANTDAIKALAEAINVQAAALNALAESIAAATSDEPKPESETTEADAPRYIDGTPIGR